MNPATESDKINGQILKLLAEHIGVEPEDIDSADYLIDDLHMSASELADFSEKLKGAGFDTSGIDLMSLETVGDLLESIEK